MLISGVMKKVYTFLFLIFLLEFGFAQSQWYEINKSEPTDFIPKLVNSSIEESVVEFSLDGFYISGVNAPVAKSKIVGIPRTGRISEAGAPDLVQLTVPLIIPDLANMEIEVVESEYFEMQNIEIAPSKGDFSRQMTTDDLSFH